MNRVLGILLLLGSLGAAWIWMQIDAFLTQPLGVPESGIVVTVPKGTTLAAVARDLETQNVLGDARHLEWYGRYTGQASQIRAGEYRLEPGLIPDSLLALLVSGRSITYSLTLVEGWNIRQIRTAVAAHEALTHTLGEVDDAELMAKLGRPDQHPEGRFFPDTYQFTRGTSDLEFLRRAMLTMDRELATAWENRSDDAPLKTPYEALILASIIEKETGQAGERSEIAGVFARRLRKGMKLQTDPTVIYGMGERFDGNIRRKDLREDTPYNTYVHKGLPPTPICMPGRAALQAAVSPAAGKALFFVSRGDGSHVFSETLKQHNAAVRKYQLKK